MNSFIFFLGKPTSGKGTQIRKLHQAIGGQLFSVGEELKKNIAKDTLIGKIAEPLLDDGKYISDELAIDMFDSFVLNNGCSNFFIIDGFPRTTMQFDLLNSRKSMSDNYIYIYLDLSNDSIMNRVKNRFICSDCHSPFSAVLEFQSADDIQCPECVNGMLIRRDDDNEFIMKKRVEQYDILTAPMVAKIEYSVKNDFLKIDASKSIDGMFNDIIQLLQKRCNVLHKSDNYVQS